MFITLEGIEGSGKTSQIGNIEKFFIKKGFECILTREPGDTKICKKIRAILLDPDNNDLDPLSELFLYAANRAQHLKERVNPSLKKGKIVLCDRFSDATTAYQGYARGLNLELIQKIHRLVLKDLKPDKTFLLDLPPETGLKRAWDQINSGNRTSLETRFEKENILFHKKVREGYLKIAENEPDRFIIIDASQDQVKVKNDILNYLKKII